MDRDQIEGSFRQFPARIKRAAGTPPGDQKPSTAAEDGKIGAEIPNSDVSTKDMARAIERWANEGGAGGEVNR